MARRRRLLRIATTISTSQESSLRSSSKVTMQVIREHQRRYHCLRFAFTSSNILWICIKVWSFPSQHLIHAATYHFYLSNKKLLFNLLALYRSKGKRKWENLLSCCCCMFAPSTYLLGTFMFEPLLWRQIIPMRIHAPNVGEERARTSSGAAKWWRPGNAVMEHPIQT